MIIRLPPLPGIPEGPYDPNAPPQEIRVRVFRCKWCTRVVEISPFDVPTVRFCPLPAPCKQNFENEQMKAKTKGAGAD